MSHMKQFAIGCTDAPMPGLAISDGQLILTVDPSELVKCPHCPYLHSSVSPVTPEIMRRLVGAFIRLAETVPGATRGIHRPAKGPKA